MQSCSPLKAQTQTGIHLFLFKVIFALPRWRQTQKSHAVYITTLLLVFHWHIFPPPFPRAHSSEAKGREKTAELSLFCWEWFRRALGSGDTTFWCWKEERHFWEEKAGRKSSICSAPSCCCDRASSSTFVPGCPCHKQWGVLRGWRCNFTEELAEIRAPQTLLWRQPWQGRQILPSPSEGFWDSQHGCSPCLANTQHWHMGTSRSPVWNRYRAAGTNLHLDPKGWASLSA